VGFCVVELERLSQQESQTRNGKQYLQAFPHPSNHEQAKRQGFQVFKIFGAAGDAFLFRVPC
jgi:hypothetical protein